MQRSRSVRVCFVASSVLCAALLGACTAGEDSELGSQQQATAGIGVMGTLLASSSLGKAEVEIEWGGEKAKIKGPTTLVMQELTFQPGGHTGWHTHGGPVFVSIVSGSLTLFSADDPATGKVYPAGTAFVDPGGDHVHIACNPGEHTTLVRAQYVLPTAVPLPLRIDAAAPDGAQPCS